MKCEMNMRTWSIIDVLLKVKTESFQSENAQARMPPSSWGAQDTEFSSKMGKPNERATVMICVTRTRMQSMFFNLDPPSWSSSMHRLFLPDQHLFVI